MKTKFLIEVPHEKSNYACYQAMQVFLASGSHFLANAEWGCPGDDHRAVMIVEVENREQALQIVPPIYRKVAKITEMMHLTRDDMKTINSKLLAAENELHHKHDHS